MTHLERATLFAEQLQRDVDTGTMSLMGQSYGVALVSRLEQAFQQVAQEARLRDAQLPTTEYLTRDFPP